jgi:hypothetical protein
MLSAEAHVRPEILLVLLTSACSAPPPPGDGPPPDDDPAVDTEHVGAADPPTLNAPARGDLNCGKEIPYEGKVDCQLSLTWPDGRVAYQGAAGVGRRGRSSSGFPKGQFAVELRDDAGEDTSVDLFGMGAEADWVLNGMYIDRALFRNKLSFDLYEELTGEREWAPESVYLELDLDGRPQGVYALVERVDHGEDRVPVLPDDGSGDTFIVRADEEGFYSPLQYGAWLILYPPESARTPLVDARIQARIGDVELRLKAHDPKVWDVLDLDSMVAFVLLEEFMKNNDAYYLSHHMYMHEDGKIHFVPWDLDLSLGQPLYNENWRTDSWVLYRTSLIQLAVDQPEFQKRMVTMWVEWRAGALETEAVVARMHGYQDFLGDAIDRNFAIWPIGTIQFGGKYLYPVSSPEEEMALVEAWTREHLAWMDENVSGY